MARLGYTASLGAVSPRNTGNSMVTSGHISACSNTKTFVSVGGNQSASKTVDSGNMWKNMP